MTIDLRWLALLLPFVMPFVVAGTIMGVFAITGAEIIPENREAIAGFSLFAGCLLGVMFIFAIFEVAPIHVKLWGAR